MAANGSPMATPETLIRPGATIRYWSTGEQHAPTVVCTHGATLDHATFADQVSVLHAAGYRVVTWDLRRHGASQPSNGKLTIAAAAADLATLLTEIGGGFTVLVGQSFGGLVVQELYRRHPDRIAALVIAGSPALADRAPWHQRMLNRTRPFLLRVWPERHLRSVLPAFMSRRPEVRRYVAQATEPVAKATLVAVTEAALEGMLTTTQPPQHSVPTLVVHGGREQRFVVRMIRAWAARDPQVEVEAIPDAGHLVNHDEPAAFNAVLLRFLRRHAQTASGPHGSFTAPSHVPSSVHPA